MIRWVGAFLSGLAPIPLNGRLPALLHRDLMPLQVRFHLVVSVALPTMLYGWGRWRGREQVQPRFVQSLSACMAFVFRVLRFTLCICARRIRWCPSPLFPRCFRKRGNRIVRISLCMIVLEGFADSFWRIFCRLLCHFFCHRFVRHPVHGSLRCLRCLSLCILRGDRLRLILREPAILFTGLRVWTRKLVVEHPAIIVETP